MSNIIDEIKKSRLFILGAGFSAAAGIPMIGDLLSNCMRTFRQESSGIFARVNNYALAFSSAIENIDYKSINFADFCTFLDYIELREYGGGERFSDNGSREKLAFKYYLAKEIVNATPAEDMIPDLYVQFVKQLSKSDIIITFNWDPLLELALHRIGKTYAYNNKENVDIHIYKMHGSVNWRINQYQKAKFAWESLGFTKFLMKEEMFSCDELLKKESWVNTQWFGEVEPYLVLPGSGKAYDVRPLAPIWYKPEDAFAITHHVYIIGLSLSDDDFFIKSFFINSLPDIECYTGIQGRTITIINPDPSIEKNYSFIREKKNVKFVFEKFSKNHIQMMNEDD